MFKTRIPSTFCHYVKVYELKRSISEYPYPPYDEVFPTVKWLIEYLCFRNASRVRQNHLNHAGMLLLIFLLTVALDESVDYHQLMDPFVKAAGDISDNNPKPTGQEIMLMFSSLLPWSAEPFFLIGVVVRTKLRS